MAKESPPIAPYLKWAGGKRQLLAEIKKRLPGNVSRLAYYEPFVGAGALFFELRPAKAVINDCNGQLILSYRAIKNDAESLIKLLASHKEKNSEDFFYELRNLDRDSAKFNALTDLEKAARLIFLNKTCFNGLYRVNSRGFFNAPYGRYRNPKIYDETALRRISAYLNANEIEILNVDFEEAVEAADENSFIYFDPPYHSPDKTNFSGYRAGGFGEGDQARLRDVMARMARRGAKCLLSNSDTAFIRDLYRDGSFETISLRANRRINSDPLGRGEVNEVLIKNWR